jgi:hypothetical protein
MTGAVPRRSHYVFLAWTGTALYYYYLSVAWPTRGWRVGMETIFKSHRRRRMVRPTVRWAQAGFRCLLLYSLFLSHFHLFVLSSYKVLLKRMWNRTLGSGQEESEFDISCRVTSIEKNSCKIQEGDCSLFELLFFVLKAYPKRNSYSRQRMQSQ